jgi:y4mF family transcriptional regulator
MLVLELGKTIKERRSTLGITQPDLAEMAGISVNTLYKIETGQANPTVTVLNKIAAVLGLELTLIVRNPEDRV